MFFSSAMNARCFWTKNVPVLCETARPTARRTTSGCSAPNVINAAASSAKTTT